MSSAFWMVPAAEENRGLCTLTADEMRVFVSMRCKRETREVLRWTGTSACWARSGLVPPEVPPQVPPFAPHCVPSYSALHRGAAKPGQQHLRACLPPNFFLFRI